jgi:uncharacterized protein (UPF0305 family)
MEAVKDPHESSKANEDPSIAIRAVAARLATARTKGELGKLLACEVRTYSLFDLQIIGGRLNSEIQILPSPYRENIRPHFREQLFGKHHRLLAMEKSGAFNRAHTPITDPDRFRNFCGILDTGCFSWDDQSERNVYFQNPKNRLFSYLIAAFTMFVLDEPGHPVGMPFPGGFTVERRGSDYYCLIRDKEKEITWSICNFCPAKQAEER